MEIIKSVNVPDTLRCMAEGETASVSCVDFAPLQTVQAAITRLNASAGWKEYECRTPNNGATIVITRNVKPEEEAE